MTVADAYALTVNGTFDKFDDLVGLFESLKERLEALPEDLADEMMAIEIMGVEPGDWQIIDTREEWIEKLDEMMKEVGNMQTHTQKLVAAIP